MSDILVPNILSEKKSKNIYFFKLDGKNKFTPCVSNTSAIYVGKKLIYLERPFDYSDESQNLFSFYQKMNNSTILDDSFRKIGHSARDSIQASWHNTDVPNKLYNADGWEEEYKPKSIWEKTKDIGGKSVPLAAGLAGVGSKISGIATQSLTVGRAVIGRVAAASTPLVAGLGGVLSLGLMVYDACSSRDKRHEVLKQYVWSLLDECPPTMNLYTSRETMREAVEAAIYLQKEAPSQYKLMGTKLKNAQLDFNIFWSQFQIIIAPLQSNPDVIKNLIETYDEKALENNFFNIEKHYLEYRYNLEVQITDINKAYELWLEAIQPDGAVFELMRRLVHMGNYLQASYISQIGTFSALNGKIEKYSGQGQFAMEGQRFAANTNKSGVILDDVLANWDQTLVYRIQFKTYSDLIYNIAPQLELASGWVTRRNFVGQKSGGANSKLITADKIGTYKLDTECGLPFDIKIAFDNAMAVCNKDERFKLRLIEESILVIVNKAYKEDKNKNIAIRRAGAYKEGREALYRYANNNVYYAGYSLELPINAKNKIFNELFKQWETNGLVPNNMR